MKIKMVQIIFSYITAIFYLIASFFTIWEVLRNEKYEPFIAWFKYIWNAINESAWIKLPEIVIKWFLTTIMRIRRKILDYSSLYVSFLEDSIENTSESRFNYTVLFFAIFMFGSFFQGKTIANLASLIIIIFIILSYLLDIFAEKRSRFLSIIVNKSVSILSILFFTTLCTVWYLLFIESNIYISFFAFIVAALMYGTSITYIIYIEFNKIYVLHISIFIIILVSSIITLFSLIVGHAIVPDLWIPKTLQMLISNTIFDVLTIYITIYLLIWAVKIQNIYRIPLAIFADIVLAALLACFSLYFGLVLSDKSLSIKAIINVLIAKSPDGANIELGPYFWVMHSTFIPTLLYCLLIFTTWLAKVMLIPVVWFFGKGQESKSPLSNNRYCVESQVANSPLDTIFYCKFI